MGPQRQFAVDDGRKNENGLKPPAFAALALAFASLGDAFLYPFLPLNFAVAGIPVLWVGLILSINRFVRILSNTLMVHMFARYGLRSVMFVAVILAIASTFGYGLAAGIFAWVMLRILWGLAFSATRIGALGYALHHQRRGIAFGVSRSLQETGPMLSLFIAPLLLKYLDPSAIFFLLSFLSLPAIYFVFKLPVLEGSTQFVWNRKFLHWPPSLVNSITFLSALVADGIIIVALGALFLHHGDQISLVTATALAAFYLGYRRICMVTVSAAGGWIADKLSMERVFSISLALVTLGLVALISGWIKTGALIVFTFYSVNSAITPGYVARSAYPLSEIAENATWRDMGAAVGTLLAGFLIYSKYLNFVLTVVALIMVSLLMAHLGLKRRSLKLFFQWK